MTATDLYVDLTPWKPTPTDIPAEWKNLIDDLARQAKGTPHEYVLKVKYDAQGVGDLLRSWGLPLPVVMAGYLMEYDKKHIQSSGLEGTDQILQHMNEAYQFTRDIEDENLPPLLTPPYEDLGALLIAVAIYYQALKGLQEQSKERPFTGRMLLRIERIGSTLLNIAKRLGMWYFKREIEDLVEHLLNPGKFDEDKQEYERILKQDSFILEDTRRLLVEIYQEMTGHPITVIYTPCGVSGLKRRIQDAHTTATSQKSQLTGLDLVTFDVIVPTVGECYTALGALSQLGYIQDRVTDHIANPKNNGYSQIALGLIFNRHSRYLQGTSLSGNPDQVCQLQIATDLTQAIACYGCIHPRYYRLYSMQNYQLEDVKSLPAKQFWNSKEGNVFQVIEQTVSRAISPSDSKNPIVVYDKSRSPIALPINATVLDYAYALDNNIGERAVEAIVNNRKAPLYRTLQAGDIVEIRTARQTQADENWLDEAFANTPRAKRGIKDALNKRYLGRKGYELLQQELRRYRYMLSLEQLDEELRLLLKRFQFESLQAFLEHLENEEKSLYTPNWAAQEIMKQIAERNSAPSPDQSRAVWVPAVDMQLTLNKEGAYRQRLCGLCRPSYPRDTKIRGRLRKRSRELVVHKDTCSHLIDRPLGRHSILVPMKWQLQSPAFTVAFFVMVQDRRGIILDLTRQLHRYECDLLTITAQATNPKTGIGHLRFTIEAHSEKEVLDIWEELYKVENITEVIIDAAATPARIRESLEKLRAQHATLSTKTIVEFKWDESVSMLPPRTQVLMNPFDISRPPGENMFFGRSEEIKIMQRELCEGEKGRALIMYGPRRSGKSSICKNFLEHQIHSPSWGVLFSLQNARRQTETTIFMQLAEKVSSTFHEQFQQSAPVWEDYNESEPQVRFKRMLQECIARVPGSRLVLALDEFGGAIESYERHILGFPFFNYWKELMPEIPQLSLIFALPTSSHHTLSSKRFANVFSFAQPFQVTFLDTESAKQLLADPLQDLQIAIHPNTVALAVTLTGGNPYYMTLIGQQIIYQLNHDFHKQLVSDKDLNFVVERFVEGGSYQNFNFLKSELQDKEEFVILETMVDFMSHSNQLEMQLKKIASLVGMPVVTTRRYLDRMRQGLILEENGPLSNPFYSFKIELVRRWLTRSRSFFTE